MKRLGMRGAAPLASLASLVLVAGSVATGPPAAADGTADAAAASARPRFVQPTTSITPARGCIVLRPGFNGIKVRMVQRKLGMEDLVAALVVTGKGLGALAGPFHRTPEPLRGPDHQRELGKEGVAGAEIAADIAALDTDA